MNSEASETGGAQSPRARSGLTIGSMNSQVDELAKLVKIGACVYHTGN